jgi:PD-(D/E)XK nuclease superfamily protein
MAKMKDKKVRGEWAEMKFMTCAAEHGLCVSKPWGDSNSYDFVMARPGHFVAVQVKCTVFSSKNGSGYICSVCSSHKQYRQGRSTLSLIWFVRTSGTSFRRKRLGISGRFLCVRSAIIPGMRNILKHGICCDGPSSTRTFRPARRNFLVRHFFLVFLRFPQGILVLHSLCTTGNEISVADVL